MPHPTHVVILFVLAFILTGCGRGPATTPTTAPITQPIVRFLIKSRPALEAIQARCQSDPSLKPLAAGHIEIVGDRVLAIEVETPEQWDGFPNKRGAPSRGHGEITIRVVQGVRPEDRMWTPFLPPQGCWLGHEWLKVSDSQAVLVDSLLGDPEAHDRLVKMVVEELAKVAIPTKAPEDDSFARNGGPLPNTVGTPAVTQPAVLPFATHDGYFVSNIFEADQAESFVVLKDQQAFDQVFGVARVMDDKSHRLPAATFENNMVVAAIKRGKAVWQFKVKEVVAENGVLTVRYTATSEKSDSAVFACPFIVSVPKGKYTAVAFEEDGKVVGKIEMTPPTTQGR